MKINYSRFFYLWILLTFTIPSFAVESTKLCKSALAETIQQEVQKIQNLDEAYWEVAQSNNIQNSVNEMVYLQFHPIAKHKAFVSAVLQSLRALDFDEKSVSKLNSEEFSMVFKHEFGNRVEDITHYFLDAIPTKSSEIPALAKELDINGDHLVLLVGKLSEAKKDPQSTSRDEVRLFVAEYLIRNSDTLLEQVKEINSTSIFQRIIKFFTYSAYKEAFGNSKPRREYINKLNEINVSFGSKPGTDVYHLSYAKLNMTEIESHEIIVFLRTVKKESTNSEIAMMYANRNSHKMTAKQAIYIAKNAIKMESTQKAFLLKYLEKQSRNLTPAEVNLLRGQIP